MSHRVLVVEDDRDIGDLLQESLRRAGYEVLRATDGETALQFVDSSLGLVILDIMMPGMTGIDTCKQIRRTSNVPILFLTARSSVLDKTEGLLAGGDDYMSKPFSEEELHARVIAQLRRYTVYQEKTDHEETFHVAGKLRVSDQFNEVWKESEQLRLSDLEYRILKLLMSKRSKIFSAQNIYESVWGQPYFYCSNNTVMVHIRKLRAKIEDDPAQPVYILTEWGRGYRFGTS
ncbi:response regulator transcription factor [Paenibacillus silvae]|uniref:response regulator transcription factor n=1 Tax=Paenibacillus silvae TaxID=1325358 RepID=UPI0011A60D03|nr:MULTISPECIES: response regulator transcription factor [Paenibacillus]MCK6076873.1 response regulator transcription factor [Paenibacillus silvae]MCK6152315.1 response regulator transcription factor [Paenibacillus silvae]MCK6269620.1 response regulator transcription factor [Paenibacillus silvae]